MEARTSELDTAYVLKQFLESDPQFGLSLLAEDESSFLYVTDEDYVRLNAYMQKTGYLKMEDASETVMNILSQ